MRNLSLRSRIALATLLPLAVFGLLAGVVGVYALRRIPEQLALDRQTVLVQVAAAGVAESLRGQIHLLDMTAAELEEYAGNVAMEQQLLRGRALVLQGFNGGAALLDADGNVIAATASGRSMVGSNYAGRNYFQQVRATGAPGFSNVFQDPSTGKLAVVIAVPVGQGDSAGVLLGEFTLSNLNWARDLNLLRTAPGGKGYIIDSASTIIYHPDAARIGQSVQSDPRLWQLVMAGQPGSMLYQPPGAAQPLVVSYAPIPGAEWGLITEQSWGAVVASIVPYQGVVLGLMGLGVALALIALFFSVGRVTRPLGSLVASARRVAEGKPYETIPLEGPPDLKVLIQVVNGMVEHLLKQQTALRDYAVRVLHGQEEERLRLSHDLHDETVQELVGLTQRIDLCAAALGSDPKDARRRLVEIRAMAERTLDGVRRLSHNLRPSTLEDLGLAAALQALAAELGEEMPNARILCEVVGQEVRLQPELELTAFRIAQEALRNVRKHARSATRVDIALIYEEWGLMLMVEDDGGGFEMAGTESLIRDGHLGLAGMIERAQLFVGELSVVSTPGEGTALSLRLPSASFSARAGTTNPGE